MANSLTLATLLGEMDADEVTFSAAAFNRRAERLTASGRPDELAWAAVFGYLAAEAETALIERRLSRALFA